MPVDSPSLSGMMLALLKRLRIRPWSVSLWTRISCCQVKRRPSPVKSPSPSSAPCLLDMNVDDQGPHRKLPANTAIMVEVESGEEVPNGNQVTLIGAGHRVQMVSIVRLLLRLSSASNLVLALGNGNLIQMVQGIQHEQDLVCHDVNLIEMIIDQPRPTGHRPTSNRPG